MENEKLIKWLNITSRVSAIAILLITIACGIATVVAQVGTFLSNLAIHLVFG